MALGVKEKHAGNSSRLLFVAEVDAADASNCVVEHDRFGALSECDRASERNEQITEVDAFSRPVDESAK